MISFRKEETPLSSKIYAWSSEETKNNRNIICEYSVGEYIKQEIEELQQENEKLNNIINELEKDLKEASNCLVYNELVNGKDLINNILNDLKELKENKE